MGADDARDGDDQGATLWHGRFEGGPDEALMAYTVSLPFERRMWRDDITGSRAHVRGLARVGRVGILHADHQEVARVIRHAIAVIDSRGADRRGRLLDQRVNQSRDGRGAHANPNACSCGASG